MAQRYHVMVTDTLVELGPERKMLEDIADLSLLHTDNEAEVARTGSEADVLLVYHTIKLTERSIGTLGKCRAIIRCGVGYDNIDIEAAGKRGIVVCNVPDYGTEEVADHALMMLIALARRLLIANEMVREGRWEPQVVFETPRLRGRTLGIIGCGRIGSAMALRGKVLGLRVVIYDPYKPDGLEKSLGVERCYHLDEFLRQAEFVSLHCPLTTETRHILNAKTMSQLPRGAYVINTARGPCIDPEGLLQALEAGHVAYAALDVFEVEPLLDNRIRKHPRIVMTPHTAYYSVEAFQEMRTKGAAEARRVLTGEALRNLVNRHVLTNPRGHV